MRKKVGGLLDLGWGVRLNEGVRGLRIAWVLVGGEFS